MHDSTPPPASLALPVDLEIRVTTPWGGGGRRLNFVLNSPSGAVDFHQEAIGGKELHNPEQFQQKLFGQLEDLNLGQDVDGESIARGDTLQELTAIGHDLYLMLFPREMQQIYREIRNRIRTVLITSDEPWIPWEILRPFDGEDDDFFCMKFQLSRWLTGETSLAAHKKVARLVCVEAGEAGLSSAATELQFFKDLVSATPGLDGLFQPGATSQDIVRLLEQEGFDLVHFVGHGQYDDQRPGESKVNLEDQAFRSRQIPPGAEKKLRRDRPVVFLNACQVGRLDRSLTDLDGWAPRWINRCGCSAFLAPVWSVEDECACHFARVFYQEIREGRTLGEAVLLARHKLRDKDPGDMTWLAYRLYGHPNGQIFLGNHRPVVAHEQFTQEAAGSLARASKPSLQPIPQRHQRQVRRVSARAGKSRKPVPTSALHLVSVCLVVGLSWLLYDKWLEPLSHSTDLPTPPVVERPEQEQPAPSSEEATEPPSHSTDMSKPSAVAKPVPGQPEPRHVDRESSPDVEAPPPPPVKSTPKIEPAVERVPIQPIIPGKIGIVVFDRATRKPFIDVADAVDSMLVTTVESVFPVVLNMGDAVFWNVSGGDMSIFPGGDRSPWGVELLLLATASNKSRSREGSVLEGVTLTMKSQLIDVRDRSVSVRDSATHTGQGASEEAALAQAAERCLREIIVFLNKE